MSEKIAVITGAGSGIGRSVSLALSREGYSLILAGRREEALEQTTAILENPSAAICISTDVCNEHSVKNLFDTIKQQFGRLDLLFNNAGINTEETLFEDLSYAQWKEVIDTNLNGAFLCAQQAFKMMKDQQPQGGRIINNGSISAQVPRPNSAPYTSSKHAITGLTRSLALDGRKYHIACGQIDIGNAQSDMASKMAQGVPQADGSVAPEPTMEVQHVADAVVYMANLPLDANVLFLTVMATNMPFVGRG